MNVTELRNDLLRVYKSLRDGKVNPSEAKEAANVSGKIISSAKVQLEYNKYCGVKNEIDFLSGN